jgi:hypothetical protein
VNVVVGFVRLPNCAVELDGPLTTDHAPAPTVGLFAASVAGDETHSVWSAPAFAGVGLCVTVTTASSNDAGQGAFVIVHRTV